MASSFYDVHDDFSYYLTHIVWQKLKKELSKGFAQKDFFENQRTPVEIMLLLNSKIQIIILLLSRLLPSMIQILLLNQENAKLETHNIPIN